MEQRSSSACTIEEKVMMGIKEKACQEQDKMAARESRLRTPPSLSNWFGLRRSKLHPPSSRKAESSSSKEEMMAAKMASGKKEKKKSESAETEAEEGQKVEARLSSVTDHCNNHVQASSALLAQEQLVRQLLR